MPVRAQYGAAFGRLHFGEAHLFAFTAPLYQTGISRAKVLHPRHTLRPQYIPVAVDLHDRNRCRSRLPGSPTGNGENVWCAEGQACIVEENQHPVSGLEPNRKVRGVRQGCSVSRRGRHGRHFALSSPAILQNRSGILRPRFTPGLLSTFQAPRARPSCSRIGGRLRLDCGSGKPSAGQFRSGSGNFYAGYFENISPAQFRARTSSAP